MPRHKAQAPNFKERGGAKEFISEDGKTHLILKFPDGSILVLRKSRGTKKASAEYIPIDVQKNVLRELDCGKGRTLYQMGVELFK